MVDLLDFNQVRELLQVSDSTIERMLLDGRLGQPVAHVKGGKRRWTRETVMACFTTLPNKNQNSGFDIGWRDTDDHIELLDDYDILHVVIQKHVDLELAVLMLQDAIRRLPEVYERVYSPKVSEVKNVDP